MAAPLVLFVLVALFCVVLGQSDVLNFGGIIKKLLKIRDYTDPLDIILESEPVRPVPVGAPDAKYWVEIKTHPIELSKNPLRDKEKITITDNGNKVDIALPVGIEDKHVSQVISIKPQVYVVKIKDDSGIKVGDLLSKLPK